jgi:hypothetical protein
MKSFTLDFKQDDVGNNLMGEGSTKPQLLDQPNQF